MNVLIALLVVVAFAAAGLLIRSALGRTGLGVWHPAVWWLALSAVFFGIGSARIALDGRDGPALYVSGAVLAFALAVAGSERVARRRASRAGHPTTPRYTEADTRDPDPVPLRPWVVASLAALGLALIAPTLFEVGLPFLAGDITGARAEVAGLSVQVLRVTVPALALVLVLGTGGVETTRTRRWAAWVAVGLLVAIDIVLASRYLVAELVAVVLAGIGLAGWRIRPRWLGTLGLIIVLAFGGIGILRAYDQAEGRELAFAVERTINRVVLVQPRTLEALQATIPAEQPYFGGLTWARRLGPVVGREDIPNLGYWIYPRLFPGQEPPGYAAPGIVGEAWANLGPLGLALFLLLGLLAERLGAFLARRRGVTVDLVAGALLVVFLARTHALGVNGLAVLVALVVVWRVLAAGGLAETWRSVRDTLAWRA